MGVSICLKQNQRKRKMAAKFVFALVLLALSALAHAEEAKTLVGLVPEAQVPEAVSEMIESVTREKTETKKLWMTKRTKPSKSKKVMMKKLITMRKKKLTTMRKKRMMIRITWMKTRRLQLMNGNRLRTQLKMPQQQQLPRSSRAIISIHCTKLKHQLKIPL